jgi:DUF917 family protein
MNGNIQRQHFLNEQDLLAMVYGGAILASGGGGSIEAGLAAGREALASGQPFLVYVDDLNPNTNVVTFSRVGTVSSTSALGQLAYQHTYALKVLSGWCEPEIGGIIPSEVGPLAVTYGWQQSAALGIPIVDAPCNGRSHPTGIMGSMGLHRFPRYVAKTVAVGSERGTNTSVELTLMATVQLSAQIVRDTVARTGMPLAVVRNPVPVSYVRDHAAIGGLTYAMHLGRAFLQVLSQGLDAVTARIAHLMGGAVLARGTLFAVARSDRQGFTVGELQLLDDSIGPVRIPLCNEYMLVLCDHRALAAFPDLITLFDAKTLLPLNTADAREGQRVILFAVPAERLNLASTMSDRTLLRPVEKLLGISFPKRNGKKNAICEQNP